MDQGRRVKKILEGSRRKKRPRLRWLEGVEKDLREMRVKRVRQTAVDREEWASVIQKAKTLKRQ
jgi:hypothetical protein